MMTFEATRSYAVSDYHVAIDFGQSVDYTAITILREQWAIKRIDAQRGGAWSEVEFTEHNRMMEVLHLERLPLGTTYPMQVETIKARVDALTRQVRGHGSIHRGNQPAIWVTGDATGVGRGPIDLLRSKGVNCRAVTITAGGRTTFHEEDHDWHVPKRDLITAAQILAQSGKLKVAANLPDADVLRDELLAFRYKITASANDVYGVDWRDGGAHDDLVLSLCLGVFSAKLAAGQRRTANAYNSFRSAIEEL